MNIKSQRYFFVYLTTNEDHSLVDIGLAGDLGVRLYNLLFGITHRNGSRMQRNYCSKLVYWEQFDDMHVARSREKEINGWSRNRKKALIDSKNPDWESLNEQIFQDESFGYFVSNKYSPPK